MRIFTIAAEPHKGKHIHVTRYVKTDQGVDIKIEHNVPATKDKELQWVQTVTSNSSYSKDCKMPTRVDPFGHGKPIHKVSLPAVPGICKADDLLPFYWTTAELAAGKGPGLADSPWWPAPATGRVWNQFVTGLTEVTGKDIHHLVTIAWGYDRMADGEVRVAVIRYADADSLKMHFGALRKMYPDYTYS